MDEESVVEEFIDDTGAWRFGVFRSLGFDVGWAMVLAQRRDVDWHEVEALLAKGCPHQLAVEIVT